MKKKKKDNKFLFFPYVPSEDELAVMIPPEDLTVSEWAEKYFTLGQDSAIKGLYRLDMAPHYKEIMNSCLSPTIRRISVGASAQSGKTTAFQAILGFFSHLEPSPCLITLADRETADFISSKRIKPMFDESLELSKLKDPNEWTQTLMNLKNGAFLEMAWARSVEKLGTRSIKLAYSDEVDKPGWYITTKEAGPLSLIDERLNTYPNSKHLISSTYTTEEGNISKEQENSDAIYDRFVQCYKCGLYQPLRWNNKFCYGFEEGLFRGEDGKLYPVGKVIWEGGSEASRKQILETTRYECCNCKAHWNTLEKNNAIRKASKWVSREEATGYEAHIHFHINRLISLFPGGRLESLVEHWVRIQKMKKGTNQRKELQGFINGSLAEPWKNVISSVAELEILKAKAEDLDPYTVPEEALCLVAFIDTQKNGFFYIVRAFSKDFTSWLIEYGQVSSYDELEELLFERVYPIRGTSSFMNIWRAGIDVMGGIHVGESFTSTDQAELWVRKCQGRSLQLFACRGSVSPLPGKAKAGKILDKTPSGYPIPGGLQIFHLDGFQCKAVFLERLANAIKREAFQPAYLHNQTGKDYAYQIEGEELRFDEKKQIQYFHEVHANHYLDCEAGIVALVDYTFPRGGINLLRTGTAEKKRKPVKKKPRFPIKVNPWETR